jgi:hypothetical protein
MIAEAVSDLAEALQLFQSGSHEGSTNTMADLWQTLARLRNFGVSMGIASAVECIRTWKGKGPPYALAYHCEAISRV